MDTRSLRHQQWQAATSITYDVCIIGGGASGAGCALDAASRGLRTILVEKSDFGAATSSKSTKLIHGGVRYLEQAVKRGSLAQYRMVKKALYERATLLRIAPHITRPLALITPCRTWVEGFYYYIGLKLYDWISGGTNIGGSELLSRKKALERIPTLRKEHLFSAVLYYDGQLDDLRFNLALIQTAIQQGATCFNHASAIGFGKNENGQLQTLTVQDHLTGVEYKLQAKSFINATGPFADNIRLLANEMLKPRILVSRGVHILLPKHMMPSSNALLIPKTKDGRLIFAIPYQKHLLVGTTDDAAALTEASFGPTAEEVHYLLEYINDYLDVKAAPSDVMAGFGGLRPLIMANSESTKDLVRDHEVETDARSGLISILGGKWTTYRLMAKDTLDEAAKTWPQAGPCISQTVTLVGSQQFSHNTAIQVQQHTGWDHEVVKHLVSKYGDKAHAIAEIANQDIQLKERLLAGMPFTFAELHYVVQYEMAYTLADIIGRRWGVELANWQQTLQLIEPVAKIAGPLLGWTKKEEAAACVAYSMQIQEMVRTAGLE